MWYLPYLTLPYLTIYINKHGVSKTDLPNSWITKPKKSSKIETIRINDHSKKDDKTFTASSRQLNEEDRSILCNKLGNCPMKWMLGPEPTFSERKNVFEASNIEDLLEMFMEDKEKFQEACRMTIDQINWVAANTKDQRGGGGGVTVMGETL